MGYDNVLTIGQRIDSSIPIMTVHTKTKSDLDHVRKKIEDCFVISEEEANKLPEIYEVII